MTNQPSEPQQPTRVGDYTLLAKIGEGGMGVVHLARRPGGDRVALKVLRQHIVGDDEARSRLAREVSSLSRIRSRWVAEIVDADPWAPVPYVATRYVPGLSLHDHVAHEGVIADDDLLWFAACLAEGLASVHGVGVLHRDVKPSNVLMEGRTPILIDFGLARVADDPRLTHTGWLLGTPGYLAPEILYGEDATPASDVHSWAATVAFAATGRSPFGRGPSMAIMDRVRRGQHDLAGLDGALHGVVVAALDPEPQRRPSLESILAWLRPRTTRPSPVLAPAPVPGPGPAAHDEEPDPFAATMALFGPSYDDGPGTAPAAPTLVEQRAPGGTRLMPTEARQWPPHPPAPSSAPSPAPSPAPAPSSASAPGPTSAAPTLARWQVPPPYPPTYPPPGAVDGIDRAGAWEAPAERVALGERLRRLVLVLAGATAVGAACAAVPWLAVAVLVIAVWLLRSGSLAASAVEARRQARGRKWYDGIQLLVHTPWHLVQSLGGTVLLVLWSAGLAAAVGLVCYAVAAPLAWSLFGSGVILALSLWWGPGGRRVRSPLGRVVAPASRTVGWWLIAVAVLLGAVGAGAVWIAANDVAWVPASDVPFEP
ncbi:serine/threonine-protein kinase [Nocardioides sp.]|uniref:serine/threonine-protein kinase n=1 Tax=Nocardioides sp. TaxID=35761 RepID=UPI003219C91F